MAESAVLEDTGYYFYGVVPAGTDVAGLQGLDGELVEAVEHDGLAAVVSRLRTQRPPGRSAELVAHAGVVDALAATTTVVPARFGLVVGAERDDVVRVLAEDAEPFRAALEQVAGRVQVNLRATYLSHQVLAEVVRDDPLVAELRQRTRELPPGTHHPDLVRLGEAVARGLERKRRDEADAVLEVVLPHVERHVVRPGTEYDVLDTALLLPRDGLAALEDELEVLAEAVHERIRVRLVGPVAPYDFVEGDPWG